MRTKQEILDNDLSRCGWIYDFDMSAYETDCDEAFVFDIGTPEENSYNFCPNCGKRIQIKE